MYLCVSLVNGLRQASFNMRVKKKKLQKEAIRYNLFFLFPNRLLRFEQKGEELFFSFAEVASVFYIHASCLENTRFELSGLTL